MRPPRRLQFTREGKYFVGITFGVGFAAINTGNNLLYLLLGMMLSLIIASGVLSEMSLRGLRVERQPPARIHAGRPFLMGIGLENGKLRLPSFSIEVEDLVDAKPLDKKCYFLKLPAGRLQHTSYRHVFARRGRYTFTAFRLSTKFPFALFRKSRVIDLGCEVIVFPQIVPLDRLPAPRVLGAGEEAEGLLGRRGEFHGLKEFRDGDDPRDIHWRSSARRGRAIVREHEDESRHRVTLFIDNSLPGGERSTDDQAKEALERTIGLGASMAADYLERGYAVRTVLRGEAVPWLRGSAQLPRLLRVLALVPTVENSVPFSGAPDGNAEPVFITRRGTESATFGRVVEA